MILPSLVVSDTSPVSALVVMGWLEWLRRRWQVVHVPEMVWRELRRQAGFFLREELIDAVAREAGEEIKNEKTTTPTEPP